MDMSTLQSFDTLTNGEWVLSIFSLNMTVLFNFIFMFIDE